MSRSRTARDPSAHYCVGPMLGDSISEHVAMMATILDNVPGIMGQNGIGLDNDITPEDAHVEAMYTDMYGTECDIFIASQDQTLKKVKRRKTKMKPCYIGGHIKHIRIPNTMREILKHEFSDEFLLACAAEM